jgi:hypothetical protein
MSQTPPAMDKKASDVRKGSPEDGEKSIITELNQPPAAPFGRNGWAGSPTAIAFRDDFYPRFTAPSYPLA